jgi:ABC-type transport system involved in cytochrome c biogenesis permease subunit
MAERTLLWMAVGLFGVAGLLTLRRLRAGEAVPVVERLNYALMAGGFALQTAFLYLRGHGAGRCPLTNLFEVQVFIAWAAVLFYLLIGPAYRVSFLGAFTAPLVVLLMAAALLAPVDVPRAASLVRSPWVEFHAAIAILATGAFALAFVTGAMYLLQERQLKTRRLMRSFLLLPAIEQLEVINFRLVVLGFIMLTAGMIGGFVSYRIVGHWTTPKIVWATAAWLVYAGLLAARTLWSVRGRRGALASMMSFAFVLVGFWWVSLLR